MVDPSPYVPQSNFSNMVESSAQSATTKNEPKEKFSEEKFLKEIKAIPWYKEFVKLYGEEPNLGKNADYDYRKAWEAGIRPEINPHDGTYHWPSSLPDGTMLKSPDHPTAWKEYYMRATGKDPDSVGATKEDWIKMQQTLEPPQ